MCGAHLPGRPAPSKPARVPRRPPFWHVVLGCRCPRCGRGGLFSGLLTTRPACNACGLSFRAGDAGDAAASGLVLLLGAAVVSLVLWVEFRFHPSPWVPAVLWPIVAVPLAIGLMRPLKAALVAQRYRHRLGEMEL